MDGEASGSRRGRGRAPKPRQTISYEQSVANLSTKGKETLRIVNQCVRAYKRPLNSIPGTSVSVFDNTCPTYNWLKDGWIVEERVMRHGRLYKYYYDPLGQSYNTREQVRLVYEELDKHRVMVIID